MSADDPDTSGFRDQPISQMLVKVASRCNIDCTYCYWFRDAAVYDKPKLMSADVLERLLQRVEEHVARHSLPDFPLILHGGEPLITALLGNNSPTEGVGHKPIELCTVMTDGSVEAHDVLRIAGDGFTQTRFNIFEHAIDEVRNEPRWKAARDASINLCDKCRQCKFMNACGGGYLPHRFSKNNGYDNPSVYCDDLYSMFENMQSVLANHLYVSKPDGERLAVRDALLGT
jgi:radical SAM protein with 4Fe4S-binding SPASM domain